MKNLKSISSVILLVILGFATSCTTKDEALDPALPKNQVASSSSTTTPILNGTFTVLIDGQLFTSNQNNAFKSVSTTNGITSVSYSITGNLNDGANTKSISIQFFEHVTNNYETGLSTNTSVGKGIISYVNNIVNPQANTYISTNPNNPFVSTGNIFVSSNSTVTQKISGTFNCSVFLSDQNTQTLIDTKVFTNGVFSNIYYTII